MAEKNNFFKFVIYDEVCAPHSNVTMIINVINIEGGKKHKSFIWWVRQ